MIGQPAQQSEPTFENVSRAPRGRQSVGRVAIVPPCCSQRQIRRSEVSRRVVTRLGNMDRHSFGRRTPRVPSRRPRRGTDRTVAVSGHRTEWWWLSLGAGLLALLLFGQRAQAQGLRSSVATVTLTAIRHPDRDASLDARRARDIVVPHSTGPVQHARVVSLAANAVQPLFVRGTGGRLERVHDTPIPIPPGPLQLRVVGAAAESTAWQVRVRWTDDQGRTREQVVDVR